MVADLCQRRGGKRSRCRRRQDTKGCETNPVDGHPNNIAINPNGRRCMSGSPGSRRRRCYRHRHAGERKNHSDAGHHSQSVRHSRRQYVVAGSIQGKTVNVIDAETETPVWTLEMDWRAADDVQHQRRRLHEVDIRSAERPQRIAVVDLPRGRRSIGPESAPASGKITVSAGIRSITRDGGHVRR